MKPESIKAQLRAAKTVEAVDAIARASGNAVQEMSESPTEYIHAIHIRNLAAYRRKCIEMGWG